MEPTEISAHKHGFTLIELLVVLAVVGSLVGLFSFSFLGGGVELDAAQRQLVTLVRQTRTIAVSEGRETRLIVQSDTENLDFFYSYFEIISEGNSSNDWVVQKEGEILPKGVRVLPEESSLGEIITLPEDWYTSAFSKWSSLPMTTSTASGSSQSEENLTIRSTGSENEFCFISFDASGRVLNNPRMVLSSAEVVPKPDGSLSLKFSNRDNIRGILIQPYGGIISLEYRDFAD